MSTTVIPTRTRFATYARRGLQILVGVAFIAAAGAKLSGAPQMVELFDQVGFGQWFRYVVAIVELVGGVLVMLPRRNVYGALLLTMAMVGALGTHFLLIGGAWQPAAVLLVLSAVIAWLNRRQLNLAF